MNFPFCRCWWVPSVTVTLVRPPDDILGDASPADPQADSPTALFPAGRGLACRALLCRTRSATLLWGLDTLGHPPAEPTL